MMAGETRAHAVTVRQMAAPHPAETYCSNCGKVVLTVVEYEPGTCTYLTDSIHTCSTPVARAPG